MTSENRKWWTLGAVAPIALSGALTAAATIRNHVHIEAADETFDRLAA